MYEVIAHIWTSAHTAGTHLKKSKRIALPRVEEQYSIHAKVHYSHTRAQDGTRVNRGQRSREVPWISYVDRRPSELR